MKVTQQKDRWINKAKKVNEKKNGRFAVATRKSSLHFTGGRFFSWPNCNTFKYNLKLKKLIWIDPTKLGVSFAKCLWHGFRTHSILTDDMMTPVNCHSCSWNVVIRCLFSDEWYWNHTSRRKSQLTQACKPDPSLSLICVHTHVLWTHLCEKSCWSHSLLCDTIIISPSSKQAAANSFSFHSKTNKMKQ